MTKWEDNTLQFPRLLSEIYSCVEFFDSQKEALCESMDLEWEDIEEILERADEVFQEIKLDLLEVR